MTYQAGYRAGFHDAIVALDTGVYNAIPEDYGMVYSPDSGLEKGTFVWEGVPVETIDPTIQTIYATEPELRGGIVDGLVEGVEPMREGYLPHLVRKDGDLYVIDGHHRVAVYTATGQSFEAQVMDI